VPELWSLRRVRAAGSTMGRLQARGRQKPGRR
jgi:hypothetical protein